MAPDSLDAPHDNWIRVPPVGRLDAKVVIIGEAPSHYEVEHKPPTPFVGPAGRRLSEWLTSVGLTRQQCYILNLIEYQVPNNKIDLLPKEQVEPWMGYLHERLAMVEDPYVIVPLGNYPLYALTGLGAVSWHQRDGRDARAGITKWRGSILGYQDQRGRTVKVIPTCHPSATFRQPSLEEPCRADWKRVREEMEFRELRLPQWTHHINPTLKELHALKEQAANQAGRKLLVLDIENPKRPVTLTTTDPLTGKVTKKKGWGNPEIVCIGFSAEPGVSVTVPLVDSYWREQGGLDAAWQAVKELCEDPRTEKVLHNSYYDRYYLAERGIQLVNLRWDTLFTSHARHPSAYEHTLNYRASLETRQPYWKSMAKDANLAADQGSVWRAFLTYNGIDCCVTRQLIEQDLQVMDAERRENGMTTLAFYERMYEPLLTSLHELSLTGIPVDQQMQVRRLALLMARCAEIQGELKVLAGKELYGKKGLSGAKVKEFLYRDCGLPAQYAKRDKQGTKTESSNEVALRKLVLWVEQDGRKQRELKEILERYQLKRVLELVMEHQRAAQLSTFYKSERVDGDGRMRSSYSPDTDAGRLKSKKNPRGSGSNAQNVDREARDMFLPEKGMVGVNVDLSAVESRFDYLKIFQLTGDREALYKATVRPAEYDQHAAAAADIFGVPVEQVTKTQRYFGKKTAHGIFRDVHGQKLADEILKDGMVVTKEETQRWIDSLKKKIGGIDELFHYFRREVLMKGHLENSWGRRLYFPSIRWNRQGGVGRFSDELWREAYSMWPQSEGADLMNQCGYLPLWKLLRGRPEIGVLNAHVHDSLFFSVVPERAYEVTKFLVEALEQPRKVCGVELSIPCTVEIGRTWKGGKEWKQLPGREEFEAGVGEVMRC